MSAERLLAAVDLGSNSFRVEVASLRAGKLVQIDYFKETPRLGKGLDEASNLTAQAMAEGWDCLARFGTRLSQFPGLKLRAVATQTLREAHNRQVFLATASQLLGYPIEVISGQEEARLIYSGVAHLLAPSNQQRLVVDIGGRSTEIILGHQHQAQKLASYPIGSVAWSVKYFPTGQFTPAAFEAAEHAALQVLHDVAVGFPWNLRDIAYGSSGTVSAVAAILASMQFSKGIITQEGIAFLYQYLLQAKSVDQLNIAGLHPSRRAVIGGGVSVLRSLFKVLDLTELHVAQGALRQGVLHELAGSL